MKLLFIANVSDLYGASRSLLRLATRLAQESNHVEVIVPEEGPLCPALREAGVRVLVHPGLPVLRRRALRPPWKLLRLVAQTWTSAFRIARHIRNSRPDLVHTNSAVVLSSGIAARLCGTPHVWHVREFLQGENPLWPLYQWYMGLLSERILCISEAVRRQFCPHLRRRKVAVVDNGIPRREVSGVLSGAGRNLRAELRLGNAPAVGVAGRIHLDQKGQDIFVQAAAKLAREFPATVFVIVGSPYPGNEPHEQRLRAMVRALGLEDRVRFVGERTAMAPVYAAVDIWVLPAKKPEGLGNVLIEAMAQGKPVVGSATGGIPEIILDGYNGFLAPPGDAAALAAALKPLLRDPELRRRMGERGRKRFLEVFEFEVCYRRITEVYESLLVPAQAGAGAYSAAGKQRESTVVSP